MRQRIAICITVLAVCTPLIAKDDPWTTQLALAGDNASEIQRALESVPADQNEGMKFLIEHMPERDLKSLSAKFLLDNVDGAYRVWKASPWKVPKDIFLNNILPYASINERRDDWRSDFQSKFGEMVRDAKSSGAAATILNRNIFKALNVKYSTKRRRADQGPFESIETGLASCTGLSVLLIDACRSVGVPARFVGTPLWSDKSGNHSWVEVWEDGWHFTGAAEPTGDELDRAWFVNRSSAAQRDHRLHAIYAVSYKKTPLHFPLVWDRSIDYVYAVNVTDRYANKTEELPANFTYAMFQVCGAGGDRCSAPLMVKDANGKVVFEGVTKDERFDRNDHTMVPLPIGASFDIDLGNGRKETIRTSATDSNRQLFTFQVDAKVPEEELASTHLSQLQTYLRSHPLDDASFGDQSFANASLTREEAAAAERLLVDARRKQLLADRTAEMEDRVITIGEYRMPFAYQVYGEKPANGRSLYISMHGGGGAPKQVNDRQWENQQKLYEPKEGVYVAPRAPTDTWNLWHQSHIMGLFDRLIENMVVYEDVDPNRVYLMGYSAGGDGVYQLAPRMADRWAAAAMMAGHPNDANPINLRNIGFAIYVGGKDTAYKRNEVAAEWADKLLALRKADPEGYRYLATVYPEKGHWMDREDASALPWMAKFTRNPLPQKVVWKKDGNPQPRFYWLAASTDGWTRGAEIVAQRNGQAITITPSETESSLTILLNDRMLDLDQSLTIELPNDKIVAVCTRTAATIRKSLLQRFDPTNVFCASMTVELPD